MAKKTKQERRVAAKKTAIAKSISKKGMPFARTYENFEILLGKIWHIFSVFFDKYLFNPKFGKALALLLAVLFYLTINLGQQTFLEKIDNVETLDGVAVNVIVSDEAYEVSGLPEKVVVDDTFTLSTNIPNDRFVGWDYDEEFFEMVLNEDGSATFKALKEGETTIIYSTALGQEEEIDVLVEAKVEETPEETPVVPPTGDTTNISGLFAILLASMFVLLRRKKA